MEYHEKLFNKILLNNSLTFFAPSVGYSICHLDSCACNGGSAKCRDEGSVHGRSDTNSPESYRDSRRETLLPPCITVQVIIYEDISGFSYFYLTSCQISQVLKISVVWKEVTRGVARLDNSFKLLLNSVKLFKENSHNLWQWSLKPKSFGRSNVFFVSNELILRTINTQIDFNDLSTSLLSGHYIFIIRFGVFNWRCCSREKAQGWSQKENKHPNCVHFCGNPENSIDIYLYW